MPLRRHSSFNNCWTLSSNSQCQQQFSQVDFAGSSFWMQMQVLKPTTLVGTELKPPVGHAKDWMWNGDTVVHTLTRLLGPAGVMLSATKRQKGVNPKVNSSAGSVCSTTSQHFSLRVPQLPGKAGGGACSLLTGVRGETSVSIRRLHHTQPEQHFRVSATIAAVFATCPSPSSHGTAQDIADRFEGQNVLVVSHGEVRIVGRCANHTVLPADPREI